MVKFVDLCSNVCAKAKFLGKQLSEDIITKIAEQCSFKGMKKNMSILVEGHSSGAKLL